MRGVGRIAVARAALWRWLESGDGVYRFGKISPSSCALMFESGLGSKGFASGRTVKFGFESCAPRHAWRGSNRGRAGRALAVVGVRGWGLQIWKYLAELVRTDVRIRAGEQGVRIRSHGQVRVRVLRATPCGRVRDLGRRRACGFETDGSPLPAEFRR